LTFKEDGIAKIKSVSHEEILEMQNFGLEDETVGIP
jgi:hypothetical protein